MFVYHRPLTIHKGTNYGVIAQKERHTSKIFNGVQFSVGRKWLRMAIWSELEAE